MKYSVSFILASFVMLSCYAGKVIPTATGYYELKEGSSTVTCLDANFKPQQKINLSIIPFDLVILNNPDLWGYVVVFKTNPDYKPLDDWKMISWFSGVCGDKTHYCSTKKTPSGTLFFFPVSKDQFESGTVTFDENQKEVTSVTVHGVEPYKSYYHADSKAFLISYKKSNFMEVCFFESKKNVFIQFRTAPSQGCFTDTCWLQVGFNGYEGYPYERLSEPKAQDVGAVDAHYRSVNHANKNKGVARDKVTQRCYVLTQNGLDAVALDSGNNGFIVLIEGLLKSFFVHDNVIYVSSANKTKVMDPFQMGINGNFYLDKRVNGFAPFQAGELLAVSDTHAYIEPGKRVLLYPTPIVFKKQLAQGALVDLVSFLPLSFLETIPEFTHTDADSDFYTGVKGLHSIALGLIFDDFEKTPEDTLYALVQVKKKVVADEPNFFNSTEWGQLRPKLLLMFVQKVWTRDKASAELMAQCFVLLEDPAMCALRDALDSRRLAKAALRLKDKQNADDDN